jgi:hypothetical protein
MAAERDDQNDLVIKVRKWLDETGFPLEMTTAAALASAGFDVVQGDYFPDDKTDKPRELDVIAYLRSGERGRYAKISVALCIECKSSIEKPWLLFTHAQPYPAIAAVMWRSANEKGRKVLGRLGFEEELYQSPLFSLPSRYGYALSVAMRKSGDKDAAYDALMGVCTATLGHIKRLSQDDPRIAAFDWPVIVIRAPLLECYLTPNEEVEIKEIDKGILVWRNPILNRHSIVSIYREDSFKAEVGRLRYAAEEFASLAHSTVCELDAERRAVLERLGRRGES